MVSIGRDFKDAKALLAKLRASRSRKLSQYPIALPHGTTTLRGTPHLHKIKGWLNKLGHTDRDLDKLKVIHIAGTKGKGSTCAYIESMLLAHGARTGFPKRVGLYTSPHLIEYTERIRLNANPISETKFAENLFEIWDCLGDGPRSLQLLALLSFHTFIKEGVDVAIYEAHHGGEYDVTNVVNQPAVTATTTIGLDHIDELGPTIENIAWHKGGIFKTGAPALSSPQVLEVSKILKCRAAAKGTSLRFIQADLEDIPVPVQRVNASLAREACREFLYRQVGHILSEEDIQAGIRNFAWPGRFQTEQKNGVIWCLDGAHNPMSGLHTAAWFNSISHSR
ncbi:folylpolyglutamate synthase [Geosmithia morbida]|uniref:tetrahydrofolate synthase n=1 Tax=Geosmithia morbida TaxID=1094350 RepID=A0A9P5D3W7_9HYPO|nr:folylpolyglutamate synthase [Geosmithia morbida]KAF4122926.1 folylpolyglutamate synthase [Geosmithia morbida]